MTMRALKGSSKRGLWAARACGVALASALGMMPVAVLAAPAAEAVGQGGGEGRS